MFYESAIKRESSPRKQEEPSKRIVLSQVVDPLKQVALGAPLKQVALGVSPQGSSSSTSRTINMVALRSLVSYPPAASMHQQMWREHAGQNPQRSIFS